ncbi:trimethylguanosine synthase-like [Sipha flava]|uniref:Trimethylguanosine synthase n=1 Tax=Sipha flava TaxID=143950 RepID=A0A8B8GJQ0_9HEMI|nr:trimethylguanosine synthase-like [Sipha flava]
MNCGPRRQQRATWSPEVILASTTVEKSHVTTRDGHSQMEWNFEKVGRRDFGTQTTSKCSDIEVQTTEVGVQTTVGSTKTEIFPPAPCSVIPIAVPPPEATKEPVTSPTDPRTTEKPKTNTLTNRLKYWKRRYSLFSRFDEGVVLDEVSFFSVCLEILAAHMASRCSFNTVVDPFCGAGGNAIQLALTCHRVIAVDVDPTKIKLARRNAEIYGVSEKIDFRVGNCFHILDRVRADAVVTSPP